VGISQDRGAGDRPGAGLRIEPGHPAADPQRIVDSVRPELTTASDERLVLAIARWRDDALAEALPAPRRAAFALAKRVLWDVGVAEEIVQEVFVRLWHEPDRF